MAKEIIIDRKDHKVQKNRKRRKKLKTNFDPKLIFDKLLLAFGPQYWWPAKTSFEVMVGAILTQNTSWENVKKALKNLKQAKSLTPKKMISLKLPVLAEMLRPSGYFNVKAMRLKNYCAWYLSSGGYKALQKKSTEELRSELLKVNGIGFETADDILLYAFHRPVFVIDAYTRRLFQRLGMISGDEHYETLRHQFEKTLGSDVQLYNEFHALIVAHAKAYCRKKPACDTCRLAADCLFCNIN